MTALGFPPHPVTVQGFACQTADMLKALGHADRLRLIVALGDGGRTVSELQRVTGLSQPVVSGHLARLRRAGIVDYRSEGACNRYAIADRRVLALVEDFIGIG